MMVVFVYRQAPSDRPYWPGRRWLAALDAVAWPLVFAVLVSRASMPLGVVGPVAVAAAVVVSASRLHLALTRNERYFFTTWRWGRVLMVLLAFGLLLRYFPMG